jgi:hypothetical protein
LPGEVLTTVKWLLLQAGDLWVHDTTVIEFLNAEGCSPLEIHRHLRSVLGEDVRNIRAVQKINYG